LCITYLLTLKTKKKDRHGQVAEASFVAQNL